MANTTNLALPYPAGTNAPNVPADITALANAIDTYFGGAWTAFTPTSGGSTGVTTYGTSPTFACAYKLLGNKTAAVRLAITLGTSPNVSGTVSIGPLPFTVAASNMQMGTGIVFKGSGTPTPIVCYFSGTQVSRLITTTAGGIVSNTVPWTWAAADQIRLSALVELA